MTTTNTTVLFFVKAPHPGRVKTRIAESMGPAKAAGLYRCFVLDMMETLARVGVNLTICYTPSEASEEIRAWFGNRFSLEAQAGNNLGERMANAFRSAFRRGTKKVLCIGSDIPELSETMITEGFQLLNDHDAVFGPALDGGYYLIGFRHDTFHPEIFRGIRWGSRQVLLETKERCLASGLKTSTLPILSDMDTLEDLRTFMKRNAGKQSYSLDFLREWASLAETSGQPALGGIK